MDSDEREIFHYLKTWGKDFVGAKEVSRRAGSKKRFYENPDWAKINAELTPSFKGNPKLTPRPPNDPPHKPTNKLVK